MAVVCVMAGCVVLDVCGVYCLSKSLVAAADSLMRALMKLILFSASRFCPSIACRSRSMSARRDTDVMAFISVRVSVRRMVRVP